MISKIRIFVSQDFDFGNIHYKKNKSEFAGVLDPP